MTRGTREADAAASAEFDARPNPPVAIEKCCKSGMNFRTPRVMPCVAESRAWLDPEAGLTDRGGGAQLGSTVWVAFAERRARNAARKKSIAT